MNRDDLGDSLRQAGRAVLRLICVMTVVAISAESSNAQSADSAGQADVATQQIGSLVATAPDLDRLPQVKDGRYYFPPLTAPTTATDQIGNGRRPEGFRRGEATPLAALPEDATDRGDASLWTVSTWAAPNTFSHPRYFEDRMLERHGHERFPLIQPLTSGARFFAATAMLPYLAAVRPPCECEYTLGYYRPGSCAPVMLQRPPYERRAVVAETAAIAGAIIAFP